VGARLLLRPSRRFQKVLEGARRKSKEEIERPKKVMEPGISERAGKQAKEQEIRRQRERGVTRHKRKSRKRGKGKEREGKKGSRCGP
jgi:hypothetical protein